MVDYNTLMSMNLNQEDSVLCHVSTQHGTRSLDGASYDLTIGGNVLYGKTISRLYPVQIYCPNVFPNVKVGLNTANLGNNGGGSLPFTISTAQYSITELVQALNNLALPDITWAVNSTGYITIENTSAVNVSNFYFTNSNLGKIVGAVEQTDVAALTTVTLPFLPNLGGERLIHIKSEKLGHSNMLTSKGQPPEDIVFTIPLHNVAYGGMGCWQPGDHVLGSSDFKWDVHISTLTITLLDADLNPISLPANYNVELIFKVHHND